MSPSLCACCNYLIQFNLTCLIVSKWSVNPYLTMFNHHQLSFCACCVNNSNFKKTITVFVACSALVRLLPSFFFLHPCPARLSVSISGSKSHHWTQHRMQAEARALHAALRQTILWPHVDYQLVGEGRLGISSDQTFPESVAASS